MDNILIWIMILITILDVAALQYEVKKIKKGMPKLKNNDSKKETNNMEQALKNNIGKNCEIILSNGCGAVSGTITYAEGGAFTIENDKHIDTYNTCDIARMRIKK